MAPGISGISAIQRPSASRFDVELQGLAPRAAGWFAIGHLSLGMVAVEFILRARVEKNY